MSQPKSVLDNWLHYERNYTHKHVYVALDINPREYQYYLESPWRYFTVQDMEKLTVLLDKSISEIFWACYKKPYKEVAHDIKKLRLYAALERAGIR